MEASDEGNDNQMDLLDPAQAQKNTEVDSFLKDQIKDSKFNSNFQSIRQTRMSKRFSMLAKEEGLTLFSGCLALISTCVGGGIVGLPYAFLNLGIPLAIVLNILAILSTIYTVSLYLGIKDAVPDQPESLYEIGYMLVGRKSIFIIAAIMIINSLGLCMIYFITFGDTMGQLIASFVEGAELDSEWYCSRYFFVLMLAAALIAVILKKELAELEWLSIVLFVSLGLFILMDFVQLVFDSRFAGQPNNKDFWTPTAELESISALAVTFLAYSYQQNVFIIYSSLKNKNNEEYKKMNALGLCMTGCIYVTLATISIFMFGDELESQVLLNIGNARTPEGKAYWEAYIVQISFSVVLTCHIPFIFCSGKEALLIMIDELDRKSISSALWHKLQGNTHFARETVGQLPPNPDLAIPGDSMSYNEVLRVSAAVKVTDSAASDPAAGRATMKSVALLDGVPVEESNRMAYKNMKTSYYVGASLGFYLIIILGAIFIKDVAIIFDFAGAIAVSAIGFFFPATFYPIAVRKFNVEKTWKVKRNICLSYFFQVVGAINFVLGIFVAILAITSESEH